MIEDTSPKTALHTRRRPPHVVIIDEELPYPPTSGKRIRTVNLTLRLARRYRITFLCHRNADAHEARLAETFFHSQGIETVLADRPVAGKNGPRFYGRLLLNLLSPLPYSVQVHNSRRLQTLLRRYAGLHDVDLWQCEWTPYGHTVGSIRNARWVVMAHNVESLIWQRYHDTERNPVKRWYIKQQWRKFERFERQVFSAADQTIAVSQADATLARQRFGASRVKVVENGVDVAYFQPAPVPREAHRILLLGSLDWRPNLDGVRLLLDRILPEVLTREPSVCVSIVGRNPPKWLADRVKRSAHVQLHANVRDVRPFLHRCAVMAVPLRIGGGSRLKILEALAAECPVVSTRVGAEGLCLTPSEHFVQVDDVEDMAAALVHCVRHPKSIGEMARRGRRKVVERYDWDPLADALGAIWDAELRGEVLQGTQPTVGV